MGYILGNIGNICILCNVGRQSPSHSRAAIWAISTLSQPRKSRHSWLAISAKSTSLAMSGNTLGDLRSFAKVAISGDTLRNICILGYLLFGDTRQSLLSRQSLSALFLISACNLLLWAGNLGRHSDKSWQYLHSRQSLQCRSANSVAISVCKLGNLGTLSNPRNLVILGWQSRQNQQAQQSQATFLAICAPLQWSAISVAILVCNFGNFGTLSNPGRRQSWLAVSGISTSSAMSTDALGYLGTFA